MTGVAFEPSRFGIPIDQFNAAEIGLGSQRALDYWEQCARDEKIVAALAVWVEKVRKDAEWRSNAGICLLNILMNEPPYSTNCVQKRESRAFRAAVALLFRDYNPDARVDPQASRILPWELLRETLTNIISVMQAPYEENDLAMLIEVLRRWIPKGVKDRHDAGAPDSNVWIRLLGVIAGIMDEAYDAKTVLPERLGEIVRWLDGRMRELCACYPNLLKTDLKKNFGVILSRFARLTSDDSRALAVSYCTDHWLSDGEFVGRAFDLWVEAGLAPPDARRMLELFWDLDHASSKDPSAKWCKAVAEIMGPLGAEGATRALLRFTDEAAALLLSRCPCESVNYYYPSCFLTGSLTALGLTGIDVDVTPLLPGLRTIAMTGNGPGVAGSLIRGMRLRGTRPALLSLLKVKRAVKHKTVQKAADTAIAKACQEKGISPEEVVELSLDTHGLTLDGVREEAAGDYRLCLRLAAGNKAEVAAIAPDGASLKSLPEQLKSRHAGLIKEFKAEARNIAAELGVLRDQLERSWFSGGRISPERFQSFYLGHPLGRWLASRLIWLDDQERTFLGREQELPSDCGWIRLWHPLLTASDVLAHWRRRVIMDRVLQPFRQAYREVYTLNAAEAETVDFSSRFAGTMLDSQRFHGLRKSRGWGGDYGGYTFDDQPERESTLVFPGGALRACLHWKAEDSTTRIPGDAPVDQYVEGREMNYDTTLQHLRFECKKGREWKVLPLKDVDPLVFSEVMRDVDLFASVAGLRRHADWNRPDKADDWVKDHLRNKEDEDRLGAADEVCRDLLRFHLAGQGLAEAVEILDRAIRVRGKNGDFEIILRTGEVLRLPERTTIEINPPGNFSTGIFLPFEEEDPRTKELLAKTLYLLRGGKSRRS